MTLSGPAQLVRRIVQPMASWAGFVWGQCPSGRNPWLCCKAHAIVTALTDRVCDAHHNCLW